MKDIAKQAWAAALGILLAVHGWHPWDWQYWAWLIGFLIMIHARDWAMEKIDD